ncbi:DUF4143 domain-containing protein [Demequina sp.]|uniref:ATP-binding protein n=1 Tax=Demequina sp. TaxID=2050685 RepID=UPI0025C3FB5F|nr:DUF4143 domain-containing protein [Demequina sp.]
MSYHQRVVDSELVERLASAGAVLIEGPKASGKTATARHHANSEVLLDIDHGARASIDIDPGLVLAGDAPRLLDEWQLAPNLWNAVRREVDARQKPGQFILTGSATPADDATRHSGAGRFSRLAMRPMSLWESGESDGSVSLRAMLDGVAPYASQSSLTFEGVVEALCRGGWPALVDASARDARRANRDYLSDIARTDIHTVDGVKRDPSRVAATLAALSRHVATEVKHRTMTADASRQGDNELPADPETVANYIDALERLLLVEYQAPWTPHLRSRSRVRTLPTFHFADPSLAVAGLRADAASLKADLRTLGFLFESLVVRDLRVYSQPLDARVLHYRDNTGLEVDAIVAAPDQKWIACEVKLSSASKIIDDAAAKLVEFTGRVDDSRSGKPAALAVITASGYAYRRPDGVSVVPIGALGP